MRVEVREMWQDFPELPLLGSTFVGTALRDAGCGTPGSTDPPSCREALRLARALAADTPRRTVSAHAQSEDRFGLEWESAAVSRELADEWLSQGSRKDLQKYVKLSKYNPNYFNALGIILVELPLRAEVIPKKLSRWKEDVDADKRRQPRRRPIPGHPPPRRPNS